MADEKKKAKPAVDSRVADRRKVLSGLLASGALAGTNLPASWKKPVVDSVILPAHAQTTDLQFGGVINQGLGENTPLMDALIPTAHALSFGGGCVLFGLSGSTLSILLQESNGTTHNGSAAVEDDAFATAVNGSNVSGNLNYNTDGQVETITGDVDGHLFEATQGGAGSCPEGGCESSCDLTITDSAILGSDLSVFGTALISACCYEPGVNSEEVTCDLIFGGSTITQKTLGLQGCTVSTTATVSGCVLSCSIGLSSVSANHGIVPSSEITVRMSYGGLCICSAVATVTAD